ncbi:hypothetical protein EPI10_024889 [Gossypium australe]|uniref:Uncharacterized protein n=1 Tax=Gossypium australe TaxID=47621 RepID=A0A5B6VZ73_9ROSI|nr:hypothetical protein EPI10_024889 [Gossypium australe]
MFNAGDFRTSRGCEKTIRCTPYVTCRLSRDASGFGMSAPSRDATNRGGAESVPSGILAAHTPQ